MDRSILCGVDDSEAARSALRVAARLAERLGARLVAAHVVHTAPVAPALSPVGSVRLPSSRTDAELEFGEDLLERIVEEEGLVGAELRVAHGFAGDRLADLADEAGAELIVLGSRGRGAFRAAFLGSVSTDVVGVARCPVLVVPPGTGGRVEGAEPVAFAAGGA